jgi:CRP-like cAMP-binding protein
MQKADQPILDTVDLLAKTEFFSDLDASQLDRISEICRLETHPGDDDIYHLGEPAEDLYVLIDGMVRFTIGMGMRKASAGEIIRRGEVFGWAALAEGTTKRVANAYCLTSGCTVLAIRGSDLQALMEEDNRIGYRIMKRLNVLINGHLTAFAAG